MAEERSDYEKLTLKQRLFVDAYVGEAKGNARKAAEIAGYAAPYSHASETRWHPKVRAVIEERLQQQTLSPNEVLRTLTEIARVSIADFIRFDAEGSERAEGAPSTRADFERLLAEISREEGLHPRVVERVELLRDMAAQLEETSGPRSWQLDLQQAESAGVLHLAQEIVQTERGLRVKLPDRVRALELIGRCYRLFTERGEPVGLYGNPVRTGGISFEDALKCLREGGEAETDADQRGTGAGVQAMP